MKAQALQQAVYDRLNDSSITSLLSTYYSPLPAIFTDVPQASDSELETAYPFISFGQDYITANDTKSAVGGNALVEVNVWWRGDSALTGKQIADAVDARLRRAPMNISGANHITTELESASETNDPDGKTKRMLLIYRVLWFT